jgi:hypothetical protein
MKHQRAKTIDDRPLDPRELRLIEQVAAALAAYYEEQPAERHRRMAAAMLSKSILREAPDIASLVG